MVREEFKLRLRGKTCVFIDWANVYGWTNRLRREVNPCKLYHYLKTYKEIRDIRFYYGFDKHPKSKRFLTSVKQIGFTVITKQVKYIPVSIDTSHFKHIAREIKFSLDNLKKLDTKDIKQILQILNRKVMRRKCDFDMEIALDCYENLDRYDSFIFFSGDGDFATLYKRLFVGKKQVIVIFAHGHMGREVYQITKGIFTKAVDKLGADLFV